jgi:uncharacterized phiE125 gp8 family phage protein
MKIKTITAPVTEPVTLTEAKAQCRVDIATDDALITSYISAARLYCERIDWRSFMTQTLEVWFDTWPGADEIAIPRPPLQSVTHVKYYDEDNVEATLASSAYYVDTISTPGRIVLNADESWPAMTLRPANGLVVKFVAGWASAGEVPQTIKQAILLVIGHWYENREASTVGAVDRAIEMGVEACWVSSTREVLACAPVKRHRIVIREHASADAFSERDSWSTFATLWAQVETVSGGETVEQQQAAAVLAQRFTIRKYPGIVPAMRVSWSGRVFDILAVLDDNLKRQMQLVFNEVIRG